ncbi:MAG: hypothetical protein AAF962_25725 [Actinomycetota bacterium]
MTPTLLGRIQSRLFLLGTVGLLWTILVVPVLPKFGASIGEVYGVTISALVIVAFFGIGWEFLYHLIQQYRWEKDWPILYGLITGIPEGILTWLIVAVSFNPTPSGVTFFLHFASTWIVVWLVANGPFRVFLLRWRFRGGRIV